MSLVMMVLMIYCYLLNCYYSVELENVIVFIVVTVLAVVDDCRGVVDFCGVENAHVIVILRLHFMKKLIVLMMVLLILTVLLLLMLVVIYGVVMVAIKS